MPNRIPLLAFALVTTGAAAAQGHPHFDDGGTLTWYSSMTDAKAAAKAQDKLVFFEYGRKA